MARCCTEGNLEVTQRYQDSRQQQDPPKALQSRLPSKALGEHPQGPTQLSSEGMSHCSPLGFVTITVLVNSLHNQVHDVEQDPEHKNQLIRK